ncbi:MAG: protein kinase [Candidatus Omnitrophica bacterium]|nr:protein kinase [Candidatus Omnitrophota bacterium]
MNNITYIKTTSIFITKTFSSLMVCLFLINSIVIDTHALGFTDMAPAVNIPKAAIQEFNIDTFKLPKNLGSVKYVWSPRKSAMPIAMSSIQVPAENTTGDVVIHIQDAHCNYGAELKIAEIIKYLTANYNIAVVNLEGGAGDYNTKIFTDIADRNTRNKTADYFVKSGRLSGGELFAVNDSNKTMLWGVEDKELYMKNLEVYKASNIYAGQVKKDMGTLKTTLNGLKKKIFSKELLEFDIKYAEYKTGKLDFRGYLEFLLKRSGCDAKEMKKYPNIYLIRESMNIENGIDFKKANTEREILMSKLGDILSKKEMEELVEESVKFKTNEISKNDFHSYLVKKARQAGMSMESFPELDKYIVYVAIYEAVDKLAIWDEIDRFEKEAKEKLFTQDKERTLDTLSKNLVLMENMFNYSFTKEDFDNYNKNEASFSAENYVNLFKAEGAACALGAGADGTYELDNFRRNTFRFYEYSFKRDEAFLQNIRYSSSEFKVQSSENDGRATSNERRATILITGGFHTENLCEIFKKRGISYVSIMPEFKNDDGYKSPYFEVLSGGVSPFEKEISSSLSPLVANMQVASMLNDLGIDATGRQQVKIFNLSVEILAAINKGANPADTMYLELRGGEKLVFGFKGKAYFALLPASGEGSKIPSGAVNIFPGEKIEKKYADLMNALSAFATNGVSAEARLEKFAKFNQNTATDGERAAMTEDIGKDQAWEREFKLENGNELMFKGSKYVVEFAKPFGAGASMEVFRAIDANNRQGKPLVLKKVAKSSVGDTFSELSFLKETMLIKYLNSGENSISGIVRNVEEGYYLDNGVRRYFAIQEDAGMGLDKYLTEKYPKGVDMGDPAQLAAFKSVAGQILKTLSELHRRGVVHADIKPGNIFVKETGGKLEITIGDFDVSFDLNSDKNGGYLYSLETIGPRAHFSSRVYKYNKYDFNSDMFAVGCVLYEMFFGYSQEVAEQKLILGTEYLLGYKTLLEIREQMFRYFKLLKKDGQQLDVEKVPKDDRDFITLWMWLNDRRDGDVNKTTMQLIWFWIARMKDPDNDTKVFETITQKLLLGDAKIRLFCNGLEQRRQQMNELAEDATSPLKQFIGKLMFEDEEGKPFFASASDALAALNTINIGKGPTAETALPVHTMPATHGDNLVKSINGLSDEIRRGCINIVYDEDYNLAMNATREKWARKGARKLSDMWGTENSYRTLRSGEIEDKLGALVEEMKEATVAAKAPMVFFKCVKKETSNKMRQLIYGQDANGIYIGGENTLYEGLQGKVMIIQSNIENESSEQHTENIFRLLYVANLLLNQKRLQVYFKVSDSDELMVTFTKNMMTNLVNNGFIDMSEINAAINANTELRKLTMEQIRKFLEKLYSGGVMLKITPINFAEVREYNEAMQEVYKSL